MRELQRMSIQWKILGQPGADNAVFLTVDSGQAVDHLLFDCGEGCLNSLRPSQIQSIAHLAFSHFHMDHVSGFDTFFRHNYNRPDTPVSLWGPPGTIELMHHRFQSFSWNLHQGQPGEWLVREIDGSSIDGARFLTHEAFAKAHSLPSIPQSNSVVLETPRFSLEAFLLPHRTIPSVAYRVTESERRNICPEALQHSNHSPGPWLKALTDNQLSNEEQIRVGDVEVPLGTLRAEFVRTSEGDSLAYLTDFRVEEGSSEWDALTQWLSGTETVISECQYHDRDRQLAEQNGHMTSSEVGRLARDSGVKHLILQHLSRRYAPDDWAEMLVNTKHEFAAAAFPPEWAASIPKA